MIELSNVWRTYKMGDERVHALRDVTETIERGDYVAIMGPSGSGKSTMLNILGCLDRPSEGQYRLDGQPVAELSELELSNVRRHKIGFIFQSFHLVGRLTARENVALPLLLDGVDRAEQQERAEIALRKVGLGTRLDHRPNELSGGERQRVAIARATIMEPRILLADEPTGNLDSAAGAQVMQLLRDMNEAGLTVIVVTHDPNVGRQTRRALLLRDGEIVARVPSGELLDALREFQA